MLRIVRSVAMERERINLHTDVTTLVRDTNKKKRGMVSYSRVGCARGAKSGKSCCNTSNTLLIVAECILKVKKKRQIIYISAKQISSST